MKSYVLLMLVITAISFNSGCATASAPGQRSDDYQTMLDASQRSDPGFPNLGRELVMFAQIGSVETNEGLLHVVEVRQRPAAGSDEETEVRISLFTSGLEYVGSQSCDKGSPPMMCVGPYVLLFGDQTDRGRTGDAWDFGNGFDDRRLVKNARVSAAMAHSEAWPHPTVEGGARRLNNVYPELFRSSKNDDPDFPDDRETRLTRFAYIGRVDTEEGALHVVEVRWVLMGMRSPRGLTKLSFFTRDFDYVGSQPCSGRAMICRGTNVLMDAPELIGDLLGNGWSLKYGFRRRLLVMVADGFGA